MTITEDRPTSVAMAAAGAHWTGVAQDASWLAAARAIAPELAERAEQHDRSGAFVHEQFELLRRQRFMSMLVPTELGGGGATHAEASAVLSELAHGCPATALALSMHTHLVAAQVWRHQRGLPAPVLARVADQQLVLISTGASDWLESSGTVTRVEGGYRVSGRKAPASASPAGNVLVTSLRWDDAPDGPQVIHAAVPFSAPGVSVEATWDTMGMRATGSDTVVLEDVFVPDEAVALIRPAGVWHPVWSTDDGAAMPLIMATYVGVAEAAAEQAIVLARRRAERPDIAPLVGRMIGRLTVARDSVRAMIDASSNLTFDNTVEHASSTLARKTAATDAVIDTVRLALEAGGGAAYARGSRIERLFRDVHGALYHPLPADRQQLFTGRVALGLDPVA
jgi:alkylation response protein AidB-like acyl-CoA dehydrogenase